MKFDGVPNKKIFINITREAALLNLMATASQISDIRSWVKDEELKVWGVAYRWGM